MVQKRLLLSLLGATLLAGCATSKVKPVVVHGLSEEVVLPVRVSAVTVDAAEGVWVSDEDRVAVASKIQSGLDALPPSDASLKGEVYSMRVVFTRFTRGSAAARLSLIGLGQIHMEGTVTLTGPDGNRRAEYKIGKGLVLGGVAGGLMTVSDVEDGFAKSVVAIFTPKPKV